MGRKLEGREAELHKRCDEVLHYIWDPIGVSDAPGARDEYYSYLPKVFALVRDSATPKEIAKYLVAVETQSIGLTANADRAFETGEVLLAWRDWIWEHDA